MTISGTITGNIWAQESNMSANAAINFRVHKVAATDGTLTEIVKSARTTELGFSGANTVQNFTASPTSTALNKGDRLRITLFSDDSTSSMGNGFLVTVGYNGSSAAADGDTYISFTETFGFQTTDPTTTTLYLTDTASDVATADVDREAWTSRGGSAANDVTNISAGTFPAPGQITDTAGGTAVSWFSKQLTAFTLSGLVKCNIRANSAGATANVSVGVEIARVDSDGTNATVWGYANRDASTASGGAGEIATTETAYTVYVSGDDLAFTDGQRLRIRLFQAPCADLDSDAGFTVTSYYNGPTGGASGDTFLIFGQTLTEYVAPTATGFPFPRKDRRVVPMLPAEVGW